jgi:excisionase family DNA binding protein
MDKLLYRVSEVGEVIGFRRTKVYDLIREGRLRAVDVDGVLRVPASAIEDFVRSVEASSRGSVPKGPHRGSAPGGVRTGRSEVRPPLAVSTR